MRVLIVEDEPMAARRLIKILTEVAPDTVVLGCLDSVEATILWLSENPPPDLMLLDIHLSDGSAFEIFKHVSPSCPIVFTTAYDEYALQAFRVHAVDYLLKPIKAPELAEAIRRSSWQKTDYAALLELMRSQHEPRYLRRMLIRSGQSLRLVDTADAAYFFTRDKITFVVVRSSGKRFPVDYPLEQLESLLDPRLFFRINRQFIIHIAAIREMHTYSKSRVKIVLEPPAPQETIVSVERSGAFKKWLQGVDA